MFSFFSFFLGRGGGGEDFSSVHIGKAMVAKNMDVKKGRWGEGMSLMM